MKTKNQFVIMSIVSEYTLYKIDKNTGSKIDKRFYGNKDLINRIKKMDKQDLQQKAFELDMCNYRLLTLRMKDFDNIFKFINN